MRRATLIVLSVIALGWSGSVRAATFQVTSSADAPDAALNGVCQSSSGDCTLRAAIQEVDAGAGGDIIVLPAGSYVLGIPGAGEDAAATGDLDVTKSVTIRGAGSASTIVDAAGLDRVFHVLAGATVEIDDLTISGGSVGTEDGGGVLNAGTLTLARVIVAMNAAGSSGFAGGGGVYNLGTMMLRYCTVRDNYSDESGGGVGNVGTMTMDGCTVSGNTAAVSFAPIGGGGGIGNADLNGVAATLTLINSTVSGNHSAMDGGGIINVSLFNQPTTVALNNVTIAANVADADTNGSGDGGGIADLNAVVNTQNSIIAENGDGGGEAPDCSGVLSSNGYNLVQSTAGCTIAGTTTGNVTGIDPTLGPLAPNGGPTETHILLGTSPALNAGSPATPGGAGNACIETDQRGVVRPLGAAARCDMGAVEVTLCGDGIPSAPVEACDEGPANGLGGCCSGACTLVDQDDDGTCDASDNCSALFNPDQRNSDGQDGGDACDVCPLDPTQSCAPDQSGAGAIPPGGGNVPTADGASIFCPAGALCGSCADAAKSPCAVDADCPSGTTCVATTFSVTGGNLSAFGLGSTSTNMVGGITALGPADQTFNPDPANHPEHNVLVTFQWLDVDDNGKVENRSNGSNTTVDETNLKAWRNGKGLSTCPLKPHLVCSNDLPCPAGAGTCPIPKTCGQVAAATCPTAGALGVSALCCEPSTNTFFISTYVFSEYGLGLDACDPLTDVRLSFSKIAPPVGDDKMKLQGYLQLPATIGSLNDPMVFGVRVIVVDVAGNLVDVEIPPGTYDKVLRKGWKRNGNATKWTYVDKDPGAPDGIAKVIVQDRSNKTLGLTKVSVTGAHGSYAATSSVVATIDLPNADRCFATQTPSGGPLCQLNAAQTTLKCK